MNLSLFDEPESTRPPAPLNLPKLLLDIATIYHEPDITRFACAREIMARFPDAKRIEVPSHWQIPELHGDAQNDADWLGIKRETLVLGVRKALKMEANTRSSDWIAPAVANGCASSCAYCVAEGTLISTPQGPVPVEQIRDEVEVIAFDSSSGQLVTAHVCGLASRQASEVLEIDLGDRVLRATAEHPIWTRGGWGEAADLTQGDEILCDESGLNFRAIQSIRRISEPTKVYNFHVPGPESYLANGVVTHNCYVARRKGHANPITTFVNIEAMTTYLARHAARQGVKQTATPADDQKWVYEIGCNSDTSIDAAISGNVRDFVELFTMLPNAKGTFATKWVNREMLGYDPQRKTRVRFSLMPRNMAKLVDVRTSPISERIAAMNDFHEAGYEVNVNFSPVIVADGWLEAYDELWDEMNDVLSPQVKANLVAEIIFLTHHAGLHEVNLEWHPRAEAVLWQPDLQERKMSQNGGENVRYKVSLKQPLVAQFVARMRAKLPQCAVRYAF